MPAVQSEVLSLWEIREYMRLLSANGIPVAGDIGPIRAGNNNIGDVDINSALPAGTNTIGATKDAGPSWTQVYTYTTSADMSTAAALTAAPPAQQYIVIDDIFFSTDTEMNFEFEEETSGTVVMKVYAPENFVGQLTPRGKLKLPTANKKLFGDASASGNVAITVLYHYEA